MKSRRLAAAGLGLVTALTFSVTGCSYFGGDDDADRTRALGANADASNALSGAAAALAETSFNMTTDMGDLGQMTGSMDPPSQRGKLDIELSAGGTDLAMDVVVFGSDMYLKMNGGDAAADGWLHLDMAELPEGNSLGLREGEFDPSGAAKFMKAIASAERVGDRGFKGTLDLTKADGAGGVDEKDLASLGGQASAVPFEATIDGNGRLSKLVIDMPAVGDRPAAKVTTTYSDIGTSVSVKRPDAATVTEAPAAVYEQLNS